MKKLAIPIVVSLVLFMGCHLPCVQLKTVNDILNYATPGMAAENLRDKCDPAFYEGGFETFLVKSVNLDTMQIEVTTQLSEVIVEVWTFEGLNDVAVIQLDKAFGLQKIVAAKRASIPTILEWKVEKWALIP
jgi:hypothetical protein